MTNRIIRHLRLLVIIVTTSLTLSSMNTISNNPDPDTNFFVETQYKSVAVGDGMKMAYLDLGNSNDPVILLLHGEPNSSFVFRNIAPDLVKQKFRVIIPDLIGFGYSDKPKNADIITYSNHTKWVGTFISYLKLTEINLFAHDWGGMIGLRIVAERSALFKKVAVSYCYLFEGTEKIPDSFEGFRTYAQNDPKFSAGDIMQWGTNVTLPDSIKAKYDSPFQNPSDYYAARKFPSLIPTNKDDKEAILNTELNQKLRGFKKPFITIWGNHEDEMWIGKDKILQQNIPGAKNQTHFTLDSNHFIQEDQPTELTQILAAFFMKQP